MKNSKPDISLISKYLNGELDERAMYQLERQAQDDPALMDMLLGMESSKKDGDQVNLSDIDQLIKNRVEVNKSIKMIPWRSWSAAASLILICAMTAFWILRDPQRIKPDSQVTQIRKIQKEPVAPATIIKAKIQERPREIATIRKKDFNGGSSAGIRKDSNSIAAITLADDSNVYEANSLNEVVVTGYVAKNKTAVAASQTTVSKPADKQYGLAGKVAGIQIRGMSSVTQRESATPLKRDSLPYSDQSLSEVVVVPENKKVIVKTYPLIGWDAYNKYLREQATLNDGATGKVTLAFTIDAGGNPTKIRIVKGSNDAVNNRAINLILGGSRWNRERDDLNKEIRLKIKFH